MYRLPDEQQIIKLLKVQFEIEAVRIKKLVGYDNLNLKVTSGQGVDYVLKIHESTSDQSLCQAESKLLEHIAITFPGRFPETVKAKKGLCCVQENDRLYRLLNWLEGEFLSDCYHTSSLIQNFEGVN